MEKSGLGCDHLGAAALVTPTSSGLGVSKEDTIASSGSQPYDPWTNYLSPRPQFLRYKPSRLREIYLRRERELEGAEGYSGFDLGLLSEFQSPRSEGTLSSSPSPSLLKEEGVLDLEPFLDKKVYEGMGKEEEDDTAEEERPPCCNLVWKVLLLLGILFFMIGYISSMHSFSTLSPSKKIQSFKEKYLKIQGAPEERAGNIGKNLEEYSGTCMDTRINVRFDELVTMENGIGGSNSNGLCKLGKMEGEKLQEEGKSTVNDGSDFLVHDVKSNANPVIVGGSEWSVHSGEESQAETQMSMSEDGDFSANNKNQNDFLDMTGEVDMYAMYGEETQHDNKMIVADDSYLVVDNENLDADMVVVERGNERFVCTDKLYDHQHENIYTGNTISEEPMGDVMVETEIEETGDVTLKLNQPAKASQRQAISGYEEKDGSSGNVIGFTFYGMKVVITVLLALAFPVSTIFCFRRLRELKTSAKDSSASIIPSCELALECDFELPTTEELKKEFDSLVNTGKFEVLGKYPPAFELLKEKLVDSLNRTDQSKGLYLYETHPPTVELLGEFSVARLGSLKNRHSSFGKKTASTNIHHSQSPEISVRNSLPSSDQSPPEFSTNKSTPRSKSAQEKLGRRQNNRPRHGAVEAASTPLRRSSRIRSRATPP